MEFILVPDLEKGSLAGPGSYQIIDLLYRTNDGIDEKSLIYDGYDDKFFPELEKEIGNFFDSENNHKALREYLSEIININADEISITDEIDY